MISLPYFQGKNRTLASSLESSATDTHTVVTRNLPAKNNQMSPR